MTEYHKIQTVYERDDKFKVIPGKLRKPVFGIIRSWVWTEKIDGTNIRLIWDGAKFSVGGKTNNASIPADLIQNIYNLVDPDRFKSIFQCPVVVYGEGYGAGIQKGGHYAKDKRFIAFDVLVDGRWWVDDANMRDVCVKLGLEAVPYFGEMTLDVATNLVSGGFPSRVGEGAPAEGLVGRPVQTLFDASMERLIIKLKTKDF